MTVDNVFNSVVVNLATAPFAYDALIILSYSDPTAGDDVNAIQGLDGADSPDIGRAAYADNRPSLPSVATVAFSADTGISSSDFITKTAAQTISGTLSANFSGGQLVQVSLDNGGTWQNATASLYQNTFSLSGVTLTASDSLKVKVIDVNGEGAVLSQAYVLDTLAPNAPSTPDLVNASDTGTSNSDNLTKAVTPTFTGTADSGATVTLYDTDGATALGTTVSVGGNWSIASSTLSQGAHTLTAKASDAAGNVSAASSGMSVTIDTTAPTLAITSNVASLKIGETATVTFTFSEDPGSSFTWDGTTGDVGVSGGTLGAISGTGLTRTATFTPTASTNSGSASITVASGSYTDTAGNNGGAGTTPSLTFDTVVPAASTIFLSAGSDTGSSSSDKITSRTTPTFTGSGEANATVKLYDTNGTTVLGTTTADGSGNWIITSSALSGGAHTITTKQIDGAGNVSAASSGVTLTLDVTKPVLTTATVNATALVLSFTDANGLDAVHPPAIGAFTVLAGGNASVVHAVAVDAVAQTVTLTLDTAVTSDQAVTVSYTDPTIGDDITNIIQDGAGNDAATFLGFAVTNLTPAPSGGGGTAPSLPTSETAVAAAIDSVTFGSQSQFQTAQVLADIAAGKYTFDQFLDKVVASVHDTVLPAVIVTAILGGERPTEAHLKDLAAFTTAQLAAYKAMGVVEPAIGPYEAMGLGYSETAAFKTSYAAMADDAFSQSAYRLVFSRAPTTDQLAHFDAQLAYFEAIYRAAGQSVSDADLHAKGAVIGQMIGFSVINEPQLHSYDDTANAFLKQATVGQAHYGEALGLI